MCNLKKRSEGQTGESSDTQSGASKYEDTMTVKDAENLSTSCSSSEADLSDADKQEVNDNRQCPLCNKLFSNPAEYTLHLKTHTDGTKCLVCSKTLSSANSLDRHLLVHSGEKPFECQQCGKAFTTNGNMNRHMKKRKHMNGSTSDSAEKKAKRVPNNNEISNSTSVNVSTSQPPNCVDCAYRFQNLVKTGWTEPGNFELISTIDCERRRTCSCKDTSKVSYRETGKASDDEVCDTCGDKCLRMSNPQPKSSTNELFQCNACNSTFISESKFQFHELIHKIADQNHVINFDARNKEDKINFLQKLGLISKEKVDEINLVHTPEELNDTKEFDITMKDENREESVKCEKITLNSLTCNSNKSNMQNANVSIISLSSNPTFSVKSPMSADCASPDSNIVQTPASPIEGSVTLKESATDNELQCPECGEIFNSKKFQTMHYYQIHLKKSVFPCPQCDYVSKDKSTLTRHMRKHTGEKPYMCTICFRKFTTETNAKRHIRNKHKILTKLKKHIECKSTEKPTADQGNTKCHYCREDFGDVKLLTQHINAPYCPGKPFLCSKCDMRFPTKNNCLRHMQHIHKLEKDQARESMRVERLDANNAKEAGHKLERNERILDAADSEIAHNENIMDEKSIHDEEMLEDNQNCTDDKEEQELLHIDSSTDIEMESSDVAIDMSKNSSRIENETLSAHFNIDTVRHRPSSTEVDVSYSMLRLSEELPYPREQEEALDLSLRPIDLTAKTKTHELNNQQVHSSMFDMVLPPHSILPPPAHKSSSSLVIPKQSSHLNLLNYLNTTATFPAFSSPFLHSQPQPGTFNLQTQFHVQKSFLISPPVIELQKKTPSCNNDSFINSMEESNDSEKELCIVEDELSNEIGANHHKSGKQHTSDNEINDLASVSSVIDTANSQDISKFLNPVTFRKTHSPATSELGTSNLVSKTNICRNSSDVKKKFPCNQCNKSFDTTSALTRHMVIHTGQKKHKCSTCGKAFGTKSNCKRHELTHLPKNAQKSKQSPIECHIISDISNNNTEFSNLSLATDQTDRLNHTSDLPHNSSSSSSAIIPTSNTLATFSHLFSGSYCPTQNLVCEYCLNTYKNFTDLSNHMRELHPSECKGFS